MSHRLCRCKETKNNRLDPYADRTGEKSSVHKCQNLAVLDRTLLSIRQGPGWATVMSHFYMSHEWSRLCDILYGA